MRIAIYPNVTKSGAGEILERVIKFANQYNIELLLPPKEGKFFYHEELINRNIEKEYIDMAISIGGDGTLLGLCRRLAKIVLIPVESDDSVANSADYYTEDFVSLIKCGNIKIAETQKLIHQEQSNEDYFEGVNDYFDGTMGV